MRNRIQLGLIINPRDKPAIHQYGDPACSVEGPDDRLVIAPTLACLQTVRKRANPMGTCETGFCAAGGGRVGTACQTDDDCHALSVQAMLLDAGRCEPEGYCSSGSTGAACDDDGDCAVRSRSYDIPLNESLASAFFPDFLRDVIAEQVCPGS